MLISYDAILIFVKRVEGALTRGRFSLEANEGARNRNCHAEALHYPKSWVSACVPDLAAAVKAEN
jgi:hypothetical protein